MRPLFFSVLKYFTSGKEACRSDVQDALRADYGNFKAFKDKACLLYTSVSPMTSGTDTPD